MSRWNKILGGVAATLSTGLAVVIVIGHVNDARVTMPSIDQIKSFKVGWERVSGALDRDSELRVDADPARAKSSLQKSIGPYFQTLITDSHRLRNPWVVFATLGSYPERLDGRDAVVVPAGASLEWRVATPGKYRVTWAGASDDPSAKVVLTGDNDPKHASTFNLGAIEPARRDSWWTRNVTRFLMVDSPPPGGQWREASTEISVVANHAARLLCDAASGRFCLITPPEVWSRAARPRSNVLVIAVDTLRAGIVSPELTPNLWRLRQRSASFERALAAGNMTTPSTTAIFTGRAPTRADEIAFSYSVSASRRERFYESQALSWPALLAESGRLTVAMGTISLFSEVLNAGVNHGFQQQLAVETEGYETAHLAREAVQWLSQQGDKPFTLFLNFDAPHGPYKPPLRDLAATWPSSGLPSSTPDALEWLYRGEVRYTDRYVGVVLDALERLGISDRTTILVTGDHADQYVTRVFNDNEAGPPYEGVYYDHGATLFNDEIGVTLLWKPARPLASTTVIQDFVSGLDIAPTVLTEADVAVPAVMEGKPLQRYLNGSANSSDRLIPSEGFRERSIVFDGRFKYIKAYGATRKAQWNIASWFTRRTEVFVPERLFDLSTDPGERRNLASDRPDMVSRARDLSRRYFGDRVIPELVIDAPSGSPWEATIKGSVDEASLSKAGISIRSDGGKVILASKKPGRALIAFEPASNEPTQDVHVTIGGATMPISQTSLRLPAKSPFSELPLESGGVSTLLDTGRADSVYLRRVESSKVRQRKIVPVNAQFESILKDWGYLNDN